MAKDEQALADDHVAEHEDAATDSATTTGVWAARRNEPAPADPEASGATDTRTRTPLRPLIARGGQHVRTSVAPRHGSALAFDAVVRASRNDPSRRLHAVARHASLENTRVVPIRPSPEQAGPDTAESARDSSVTTTPSSSDRNAASANVASEARAPAAVEPVELAPTRPSVPPPARSADTGSRLTPSAQSAARPPVLASEALRKELSPPAPASGPVRLAVGLVGVVGCAIAMWFGGQQGLGIPLAGAFAALAVLGLVPLAYAARAAAVVTVAGSGLAIATWNRLEHGAALDSLVPLIGAALLATALLYRSWHRASWLARALVALGIAICAGFVWMSGALQRVLVLEGHWQAWIGPVMVVPLVVLLLLSLLAFMDSRSTGACAVWAALVLAWYTLYAWADFAALTWPALSSQQITRVSPDTAVTLLGGPLFTVALALGLAQLLAVAAADPQ